MNLLPDARPYGVAPSILIACAKELCDKQSNFTLDEFCEALGAPAREASPVLDGLIADGFITQLPDDTGYQARDKLSQLAIANVSAGIPRAAAEALLHQVLKKADEINEDPSTYQCKVECIVVFGSFLGDKPVLGDLDLGVAVRGIPRTASTQGEAFFWRQRTRSPTDKVFSALKLRKPKLVSVHRLDEVLELKTPYQIVFGRLP